MKTSRPCTLSRLARNPRAKTKAGAHLPRLGLAIGVESFRKDMLKSRSASDTVRPQGQTSATSAIFHTIPLATFRTS